MNEELKPCPFCGSKSVSVKSGVMAGLTMFLCQSCKATVSFGGKEQKHEAKQAWNKRADISTAE